MPTRRSALADALIFGSAVFCGVLAGGLFLWGFRHVGDQIVVLPPNPTPSRPPVVTPTPAPAIVPSIVAAGARAAVAMATRQAPIPTDTPSPVPPVPTPVPNCASVPSGHCRIPPTPAPPATALPYGGLPVCPTTDTDGGCWKVVPTPTPTPRAAAPTSRPIGGPP